jgi:hypothetical protein
VAAIEDPGQRALAALMRAAFALPVIAIPARAGAAEVGEIGLSVLGYKERGLIKITEPILWGRVQFAESWEVRASALVDIVTGASAELVSNLSGKPVQTVTGASVSDRRTAADVKVTNRWREMTFSASRAVSDEEDYRSRAAGLEASLDLDSRLTTLVAGYGKSNDRIGSADDPELDERRDVREYLIGITQVLSPLALVQSTLQSSRGTGWFNDPYKRTLTFPEGGGLPTLVSDTRPSERNSVAWLTRYRQHLPGNRATLQAEYRYFRDDWGIRSHTLEVGWQQDLGERWALRPALRYYTQTAADFYSPVVPQPRPELLSSDQRLGAFGALSPSLRATWRHESGVMLEATLGYNYNAADLRPGGGSPAFETLRAYYVIGTIVKYF